MWFNGWTILSWLEHTNHKRYYLVYHTNEAVDAVSVLYFFDVLELSLQTHQQATIRHIDQTTHYCHPPHLHFTIIFVLIFENFSVHAIIIIVQQSVLKDKNSELTKYFLRIVHINARVRSVVLVQLRCKN